MENRQKKIAEKIQRKKEELKRLQDQEAELKRRERERARQENRRWYNALAQKMDKTLSAEFGEDYRNSITQEEIAELVRRELCRRKEGIDEGRSQDGDYR